MGMGTSTKNDGTWGIESFMACGQWLLELPRWRKDMVQTWDSKRAHKTDPHGSFLSFLASLLFSPWTSGPQLSVPRSCRDLGLKINWCCETGLKQVKRLMFIRIRSWSPHSPLGACSNTSAMPVADSPINFKLGHFTIKHPMCTWQQSGHSVQADEATPRETQVRGWTRDFSWRANCPRLWHVCWICLENGGWLVSLEIHET